MSTTVIAHIDCPPDRALMVGACAETHPAHARHAWHGGRLHVHLDLPWLVHPADRSGEAALVERWLGKVAYDREPVSWETWLALESER